MTRIDMPPIAGWGEEHERQLRAMQVDELFRFLPFATGAAFLSAGLTFAVLLDTGAGMAGAYWFVMFSLVTLYRSGMILAHSRDPGVEPETWAQLAIVGNVAAGLLWGLLGTVLFPATPSYRELFIVMVICCSVGGSVSSYAPVKWAHPAVALPAVVPPIFYLTFVRDGIHIYSALTAFVFMITVTGIALQQHRRITQRLRLILENRELMRRLSAANSSLMRQNSNLEQSAAVRLKSVQSEKDRADMLALHFDNTPLAMIECDAKLHLLAWNESAEKLLGDRLKSLLGEPLLAALFEGDLLDGEANDILRAAREGMPRSIAANFHDLTGKPVTATFHVTPIRGEFDVSARVALVIARDCGNGNMKEAA